MKYDTPRQNMGGVSIEMALEVKTLGLIIYRKLTFNSRIHNICVKALNFRKQLSRAAKVAWGLNHEVIRNIPASDGDREMERRVAYARTIHPVSHIELQFTCLMGHDGVAHLYGR